jgi:hypothetical protein
MKDDETPFMIKQELITELAKVGVTAKLEDVEFIEDYGEVGK